MRLSAIALTLYAGVSNAQYEAGPPPPMPPAQIEPVPYEAPPASGHELKPLKHGRYRYQSNIPEGYHEVRKVRGGLVAAGSILFGVSYLSTLILGLAWLQDPWSLVPVAGPLATSVNQWNLWDRTRGSQNYGQSLLNASLLSLYTVIAVIQTVLQAGGIALFTVGIASPARWIEKDKVRLSFLPGAALAPAGATVIGHF